MPDGIVGAAAVRAWQIANTSLAKSNPMPAASFVRNWFLRCKDLVDKYRPDLVYFDTNELPLGQAGLDVVAHYYNDSATRNYGRADVVVNGKHIAPDHVGAFVEDIERGTATGIRPDVWQTDTCIGDWHYSRALAEADKYKTVEQVVRMLVDIVSKNGNLLLNIPLRGDGTIDEHELAFLDGMANWIDVNGEGIFGSRPWKIHGEGPAIEHPRLPAPGEPKESPIVYTPQDIRFTTKDGALYAYLLAVPKTPRAVIASLAANSPLLGGRAITEVALLGHPVKLEWSQTAEGLSVQLPALLTGEHAIALRIRGLV
jgi:alpha-L-fucosidase